MEIKNYIDVFKEIKEINKKEKLDLSENLIITFIKELGKDRRTPMRNNESAENKEEEPATDRQISYMQKLGLNVPEEGLTKEEAKKIIGDAVEKKGKKKNDNPDY